MKEQKEILSATKILSFFVALSRVFGYIRDYIIAILFGANLYTDAFFVAYQVPNLFRRLFGEGTLSSVTVPLYTDKKKKEGLRSLNRLAQVIFTNLLVTTAIIALLGIIFAKPITLVQAPGFLKNPAKFAITVKLLRVVFPFLIFITLSAWAMGYLNSNKKFAIPALSTSIFNITVIIMVFVFYKYLGVHSIYALAYSVLIGVFLQFLIHIPALFKSGYRFALGGLFSKELWPVLKLMIPAMFGLAVFQLNIFFDRIIASFLPTGSISYLYYANRLMQLPLGIFGVSIAIAALPTFSALSIAKQTGKIKESIGKSFEFIMAIMLPVFVIYFLFGFPIVNLLFGHGQFRTMNAVSPTYFALVFYSIGLPAFAQVKIVNSYFFAKKDIRIPTLVGIGSMFVNIGLNLIFMHYYSYAGLALSTSIASYVNLFLLLFFVEKEIGKIINTELILTFTKILAASIIAGLPSFVFFVYSGFGHLTGNLINLTLSLFFALALYLFTLHIFRVNHIEHFLFSRLFKKRIT